MNFLLGGILFFLGASLLFYVLFAGADFGAGILEIFLGRFRRKDQIQVISHAIAPIWEANHVWLILAVVIVFVGFPAIYTHLTVYLHIPLMAVLVGIVGRGCAFTFRHYDTINRDYFRLYSVVFAASSLWTSFFLGVVMGATILGKINPHALDYPGLYIDPWLNSFSLAMGVFTSSLFAFLAAIYLTGESKDRELQNLFRRKAIWTAGAVVLSGIGVFVSAETEGFPLVGSFFENPISRFAFLIAGLLWLPFWSELKRNPGRPGSRILGAAIVSLVVCGWYASQFPVAIRFLGQNLTFMEAAAPTPVLRALLGALVIGSFLIFPALIYLLKIFKWETLENSFSPPKVK